MTIQPIALGCENKGQHGQWFYNGGYLFYSSMVLLYFVMFVHVLIVTPQLWALVLEALPTLPTV